MNQKELKKYKSDIKKLYIKKDFKKAQSCSVTLIRQLFEERLYSEIVDIYWSDFVNPKNHLWIFEVAYALREQNHTKAAEGIYEYILESNPNNTSVLNNLSLIKKENGEIRIAYELIQKAFELNPDDEIIARNYDSTASIFREIEEIDAKYRYAISSLERENDFVIEKLKAFERNVRKDNDLKEGKIPVPKWKFKVLMETDEQKSLSLLEQWLDKGYLRRTGDRGHYGEYIYEINPHLKRGLMELKPTKINGKWINGLCSLSVAKLNELSYYKILGRISKIKRSFRSILLRDLDELFLNYIVGNEKAVVILSGSLVETGLIYYCEKKRYNNVTYQRHNKIINKRLYDCDLGDLLSFFEQNNLLTSVVIHMGNISRLYRNFIHPGKELREAEALNQAKADICFVSTIEILKSVT
jgi:tetratricopeptide (TPR) repeat protein